MKIAALTSVSGSYIVPRYSAAANRFREHDIYLLELGQTSITYPWNHPDCKTPYKRVVLSEQPSENQSVANQCVNILNALQKIHPDLLIIAGYSRPSMLTALVWSIYHKKPAILVSASKENDTSRYWWREAFKGLVIKGFSSALVGGKPQKRYLIKLGMKPNSIFTGYNVVGIDNFHPNRIRSFPNYYQKPYFLAVNRFVPKKNILRLIDAYNIYRRVSDSTPWDLVLCGDGELRTEIEKKIAKLNLQEYVSLPGFLQQEQLLPYFAHASCFIHASIQEQWGLVVNEAMAAGLPILVSNRCGCYEDLIVDGVNGFGFDPENSQQLTELMLKISSKDIDSQRIGNAALEHIQKFSPDYFAEGLMQAIEYALAHR